jgi:hypothetical protein
VLNLLESLADQGPRGQSVPGVQLEFKGQATNLKVPATVPTQIQVSTDVISSRATGLVRLDSILMPILAYHVFSAYRGMHVLRHTYCTL